jgi:hypothetical protein
MTLACLSSSAFFGPAAVLPMPRNASAEAVPFGVARNIFDAPSIKHDSTSAQYRADVHWCLLLNVLS